MLGLPTAESEWEHENPTAQKRKKKWRKNAKRRKKVLFLRD